MIVTTSNDTAFLTAGLRDFYRCGFSMEKIVNCEAGRKSESKRVSGRLSGNAPCTVNANV